MSDPLLDRIKVRLAREAEGNVYLDIALVAAVLDEEFAAPPSDAAAPLREALGTASDTIDRMGWELDTLRKAVQEAVDWFAIAPFANVDVPLWIIDQTTAIADHLRVALAIPAPKEADRE